MTGRVQTLAIIALLAVLGLLAMGFTNLEIWMVIE